MPPEKEKIQRSFTAYANNLRTVDPATIPEVADLGDLEAQRMIVFQFYPYVLDRYSTTIRPSAWAARMGNFLKNPIVDFCHATSDWMAEPKDKMPVGRVVKTWVRDIGQADPGLWGVIQFASHEFAEEVYQCYRGGFLNAVSVDVWAHNWEFKGNDFPDQEGPTYTDVELVAIGCVPVPGNQDALAVTRGLESADAPQAVKRAYERVARAGKKMSQANLARMNEIHQAMRDGLKACQQAHRDMEDFMSELAGDNDPDEKGDMDAQQVQEAAPNLIETIRREIEAALKVSTLVVPETAPSEPAPVQQEENPIDKWLKLF